MSEVTVDDQFPLRKRDLDRDFLSFFHIAGLFLEVDPDSYTDMYPQLSMECLQLIGAMSHKHGGSST